MSTSPMPLNPAIIAYLRDLKRGGVRLGLERMRDLVAALGNPHDRTPVIHITGTNGKGSVAAMLEAIFRSAGWRTGLYTSPHLVRLGERIQVNRQPLSAAELERHVRALQTVVDNRVSEFGAEARPSYFEFMTALAFLHFRDAHCDVAIIEVGMGGRLDATNVVDPELSIITSVGLDHCEFLGDTLEKIAAEKAGIIKQGRPVVIGSLPAEAERPIRATAEALRSTVSSIIDAFGPDTTRYPTSSLLGDYQRLNAATATLAARQLASRWNLSEVVIAAGLRSVEWPARWQSITVGGRKVVIDASHNAEGAAALDRNLAQLTTELGRRPIVVTGVLGVTRAKPLLEVICRHAQELMLVVPRQNRACSYEELETLIPTGFGGRVVRSSVEEVFPASRQCLPERSVDEPVVVTGSIYLAGEALVRIDPSRGPLEAELQDF